MFEKSKHILVLHWHVFTLLAITWLFGYGIAAKANTPLVALHYVVHILAGCALSLLTFFLRPSRDKQDDAGHGARPSQALTRQIHRVLFHLIMAAPAMGVLVFFVPAGPWHLGASGSFWLTHVYHDNLAHLVHGATFYLVVLLGTVNWLFVTNQAQA
jgi:hypothetical protein